MALLIYASHTSLECCSYSQTTYKQGHTNVQTTRRKSSLTWLIFEGVAGDVSVMDVRRIPFQRDRVQIHAAD